MQRALTMFPKPHNQPPSHSQSFPHSFSTAATPPRRDSSTTATPPRRESSTAAYDDSTAIVLRDPAAVGDGSSVEVARRPRGRPPGSKNKPKPVTAVSAISATRDAGPAMSPFVLEIPGGSDIVEAISRFCRRRNTGLCVLHAYGSVADVTLRQPPSAAATSLTFRGRFDILSASATFLPHTPSFSVPNGLIITLAGPQGQIFGGFVAGSLIGVGIVHVIAGSFNNPSYHRLPSEDEVRRLGFSDVDEDQSPPTSGESAAAADPCGLLAMYGSHASIDVVWAPAARQPQPPSPPPHHRQY